MPPLTMEDDDGREWTAVGFHADRGTLLWVPADTEMIEVSLTDAEPITEQETA